MKKPRFFLSLLLCAALCAPLFSSCSKISDKKILTYKDQSVTEAVFRYLCCTEKTQYLYEAYQTNSSATQASDLEDKAALWTMTDQNGVSVGDTLKNSVLNRLKIELYLAQAAKDAGYSITAEIRSKLRSGFNQMGKNFESKEAFDQALQEYGVNYDLLFDYYQLQTLASKGEDLLFGEGGKMAPTDARVQKYYDEHYFTFNFIYINNVNKTYPNGKTVYMPAEEKDRKNALIEELAGKIAVLNGETAAPAPAEGEEPEAVTFESLCRAYSERFTDSTLENGLTYRIGTFPLPEIEEAVLAAEEGKFVRVDASDGVYFVARLPLDQKKLADEKDSVTEELVEISKQGLVDSVPDDFKVNESLLASVSVADLKHVQ